MVLYCVLMCCVMMLCDDANIVCDDVLCVLMMFVMMIDCDDCVLCVDDVFSMCRLKDFGVGLSFGL